MKTFREFLVETKDASANQRDYEFDAAEGSENRLISKAKKMGLDARVVKQQGPSGWPLLGVKGHPAKVKEFAHRHYYERDDDPEFNAAHPDNTQRHFDKYHLASKK